MDTNIGLMKRARTFVFDNIVMLVFIVLIVFGFTVSDMAVSTFANEVTSRIFRNGVLVLSLIIPVMAGLGLNFGIVLGALAGMLSMIFVRYNFMLFSGISGLLVAFAVATPIAIFFGFLTGKLYNKTRGQELVAGLIVSFFAEGIYLVFVLFILGMVIPLQWGHGMVNPSPEGTRAVGIRHSFELGLPYDEFTGRTPAGTIPGQARALNNVWRVEFTYVLAAIAAALLIIVIIRYIVRRRNPIMGKPPLWKFCVQLGLCVALAVVSFIGAAQIYYWYNIHSEALLYNPRIRLDQLEGIPPFVVEISRINRVPMVPGLMILAVALFTIYFSKTKLGQDCRSVGQSQPIANVAGINVDRTRIIATIISTVLAAWGMIIFLQDIGTVSTYTQHRNIGFFSVAAILVGGATVAKATVPNAIVGIILFHSLFVLSPAIAGVFADHPAIGEYTRSFMVYAAIGVSLGLYVWKGNKAAKEKERLK
jgi:simple sugar transport system permease protein